MSLERLEPVPPRAPRNHRDPADYEAMQDVTRELAFSSDTWTPERQEKVKELFDGLAPEWHTRGGEERLAPTRDALERGGVPRGGLAVEIGSGTGLQTPVLAEHFEHVVSVDLSPAMLALSPRRGDVFLLQADASRLPLVAGSADAVVCVNAFLFPGEYARVLGETGVIVFVSTSGEETPIYLSDNDVTAALSQVAGIEATSSVYGYGTWTVARLSSRPGRLRP